jgi:hypothetical protein
MEGRHRFGGIKETNGDRLGNTKRSVNERETKKREREESNRKVKNETEKRERR